MRCAPRGATCRRACELAGCSARSLTRPSRRWAPGKLDARATRNCVLRAAFTLQNDLVQRLDVCRRRRPIGQQHFRWKTSSRRSVHSTCNVFVAVECSRHDEILRERHRRVACGRNGPRRVIFRRRRQLRWYHVARARPVVGPEWSSGRQLQSAPPLWPRAPQSSGKTNWRRRSVAAPTAAARRAEFVLHLFACSRHRRSSSNLAQCKRRALNFWQAARKRALARPPASSSLVFICYLLHLKRSNFLRVSWKILLD